MPLAPAMSEDITDIVAALSDFYTLEEVNQWLDAPQLFLRGRSPSALIAEGRKDEVMALIKQLTECIYF